MELRWYQELALDALIAGGDGAVVILPTGAGKTLVIAEFVKRNSRHRILVLTHSKELVEQNALAIEAHTRTTVGIYCSGLGERVFGRSVTVGTVQSLIRETGRMEYDIVIIDEAHHVPPPTSNAGMIYVRLIERLRARRPTAIYGLTATPYRMMGGGICSENNYLTHIAYEIGITELVQKGFLCRVISSAPDILGANSGMASVPLSRAGTDYNQVAVEKILFPHTNEIVNEIIRADRTSGLVFASTVAHAIELHRVLTACGQKVGLVSSHTPERERELTTKAFVSGEIRYVVNVNVYSEGFDYPGIDLVVLARKTKSKRLYYQQIGRGFRMKEGKENCRVLDFGTNIERLGPVSRLGDEEAECEWKCCEHCGEVIRRIAYVCEHCGAMTKDARPSTNEEREENKTQALTKESSRLDPLAEETETKQIIAEVLGISYKLHTKINPTAETASSVTLLVLYQTNKGTFSKYYAFSPTHKPYARHISSDWWRSTLKISSLLVPETEREAMEKSYLLRTPKSITLSVKGKNTQITGQSFPIK